MKECKHEWEVMSVWGVYTWGIRRRCKKCERMEDAQISEKSWEESTFLTPSQNKLKTNNTIIKNDE